MIDMNKLANELKVLCSLLGFETQILREHGDVVDIEVGASNKDYFYTLYHPPRHNQLKLETYERKRKNRSFWLPHAYSNHKRILQHATLVLTERRKELNNESK